LLPIFFTNKFFTNEITKHSKVLMVIAGLSLLCLNSCKQSNSEPTLGLTPVEKIAKAMTLDEKANLVVGMRLSNEVTDSIRYTVSDKIPNPVPGAAGATVKIKRFGITPMVLADGPAGLRISPKRRNDSLTYYCTAFPVATVLASTWDTAFVAEVGRAMGNEIHEY
jgi:beta-glucosidase